MNESAVDTFTNYRNESVDTNIEEVRHWRQNAHLRMTVQNKSSYRHMGLLVVGQFSNRIAVIYNS